MIVEVLVLVVISPWIILLTNIFKTTNGDYHKRRIAPNVQIRVSWMYDGGSWTSSFNTVVLQMVAEQQRGEL